jgi:hypothetical protein
MQFWMMARSGKAAATLSDGWKRAIDVINSASDSKKRVVDPTLE